jgi:hypothetical protein
MLHIDSENQGEKQSRFFWRKVVQVGEEREDSSVLLKSTACGRSS